MLRARAIEGLDQAEAVGMERAGALWGEIGQTLEMFGSDG